MFKIEILTEEEKNFVAILLGCIILVSILCSYLLYIKSMETKSLVDNYKYLEYNSKAHGEKGEY